MMYLFPKIVSLLELMQNNSILYCLACNWICLPSTIEYKNSSQNSQLYYKLSVPSLSSQSLLMLVSTNSLFVLQFSNMKTFARILFYLFSNSILLCCLHFILSSGFLSLIFCSSWNSRMNTDVFQLL